MSIFGEMVHTEFWNIHIVQPEHTFMWKQMEDIIHRCIFIHDFIQTSLKLSRQIVTTGWDSV